MAKKAAKGEENKFFLYGGKILKSVKDLGKELKDMPGHIYHHHVRHDSNDFANWVRHSLQNEALASKIEGQISRVEMELEVLRHLLHNASENAKKKVAKKKAPVKKVVVKKVESKPSVAVAAKTSKKSSVVKKVAKKPAKSKK
ncbi:MAG: DUF5752 family protein [Nanoarchaeota archaeon]